MKHVHVLLSFVAICTLCAATASAQSSKVGFVNPQRIINESKMGRIAQEDLSRLGKEKDRRVRESLSLVEKLQESLKEKALSVTEQQSRESGLRAAVRDYERLVENSNLEIQSEERRLIQFVMQRADSTLKAIAQEMGFTLILTDPEIIGYVDSSVDITDRVINELDSMQ
ncbi:MULTISPECIES: OmpH family outer membrane protein [unclassified Pseudodesulfovibrio]|uniref:OmpH family outer membrane protein n=1 Tax=unclassified Pseudodesulfovibrio TaxID=2661612 RepID=UPI000FEB9EAE|nr:MULTISPECIES: OmpH family outer membrane protein [unclassified Pseudodesulfovibrio]MCJ2164245.1 OmpH family outer membrane protein [Pseudodesulfovibrio sp. S3-i]RWU05132.1 OmpH family outer membrane protein [Pseudodesulfovibrio sp. S3]